MGTPMAFKSRRHEHPARPFGVPCRPPSAVTERRTGANRGPGTIGRGWDGAPSLLRPPVRRLDDTNRFLCALFAPADTPLEGVYAGTPPHPPAAVPRAEAVRRFALIPRGADHDP